VLTPLLQVLYPVVAFVNAISNALVRPFARDVKTSDRLTTEELRTVVGEGAALPGQHQNMMLSILDLDDVTVDDIMIPRAEIVAINIDDDIPDIMNQIANSQHTRLPVYKENINNVIGVLHLRRLTRYVGAEDINKAELLQLTREPYFIPEATPLHTQLLNFQTNKRRLALVVDEYGDVQGIVALEDILEEIVGEFTTDYAANVPEIHPQEDGTYLIDGTALLRDINRSLEWSLPIDGPKTLNGLVLERLEFIPESSVCLRMDGYLMEIVQTGGNMVKTVKVWEDRASA
jgi:Mg2+/Co2+ transporter CorB